MGKRALILIATLMLASSCNNGYQHGERKTEVGERTGLKVCTEDTVLVEGKGIRVTVADYRYVEKLLNPKAKEFFSKHPESLLERMVHRRLVIKFVEDEGLDKKYHLKEELDNFKKEYLSRLFVSQEADKRVGKVTEKEIEKRFKELFPRKKISDMTEGDRKFIANELRVKKYDEAVSSIYGEVEKKIVFEEEGNFLIAKCCGIEVKEEIQKERKLEKLEDQLKRKLLTEFFYRKAVEAGLDKRRDFQRMLEEYYASKAVNIFRRVLRSRIALKEEEVKEYYRENREKFSMPERAKAVVFYFKDRKMAKEAKSLLEKEKNWKKVARRFGEFSAKPKTYYNDPKDPVGTLIFLSGGRKEGKVVMADFGGGKFVVVKVLNYVEGGILPYDRVKNYVRQVLTKEKLRKEEREVLNELKKKYRVKFLKENFVCFRELWK